MNEGKLIFGLFLIAIGIGGFLNAIDVWELANIWSWWPVALIAIGLSQEISSLAQRRGDGGTALLAVGIWLLIGSHHFFGLGYRTAFPIGIAVFGLSMLLHAIVDRPRPAREQEKLNGN